MKITEHGYIGREYWSFSDMSDIKEGRKGDVTRQWLIPHHRLHKIYARQILPNNMERDLNPYVFKRIRVLTEKLMNGFETFGQNLVNTMIPTARHY